jgi:acetyl-CoA/propionyl-CoA carboxylase biotin carboxyl carrier protein
MRLYAEDPTDFLPRSGTVLAYEEPTGPGVRVDSGVAAGIAVSVEYDPLLAKIVAHAEDRAAAIERAMRALEELVVLGVETNRRLLAAVLRSERFRSGTYDTGLVSLLPRIEPAATPPAAWIAAALALSEDRKPGAVRPGPTDPWSTAARWRPGETAG